MMKQQEKRIKIYPSILAGDLGNLAQTAKQIEESGADGIHIDVMDGNFVPNLTMGPDFVAAIRKATPVFLDVHLMIYRPFDYLTQFIQAGADSISFHIEASEDIIDTIDFIRTAGKQVGLALNPSTSLSIVLRYLDLIDRLLIMTVEPGFCGQKFDKQAAVKILDIKNIMTKSNANIEENNELAIQVDGGIDSKTAKICVEAGATELVSGSFLYAQESLEKGLQQLTF